MGGLRFVGYANMTAMSVMQTIVAALVIVGDIVLHALGKPTDDLDQLLVVVVGAYFSVQVVHAVTQKPQNGSVSPAEAPPAAHVSAEPEPGTEPATEA